jgi:molybdenum cofactor synthesis domain-containing protein
VSGQRTARVVTVSTRASAGVWEDRSGPVVVESLVALGFTCPEAIIVADGDDVARVLRDAVAEGIDLVMTTGGTGHTPADHTPEQTRSVIERESPGLAEAIRSYGVAHGVPMAVLSRGIAGIAGRTLIVNLPGSPGGARDGVAAVAAVLSHAVDQVHGGDHPRP